jgi:glycosyltransferase involved in cell wall biosynthesis
MAARGMSQGARTAAVGVVLPVRDEEELLPRALAALTIAGANVHVPCLVVVVLDCCSDNSLGIARRWRRSLRHQPSNVSAILVRSNRGNVGAARRLGVEAVLTKWRPIVDHLWLATTDADSTVPADWLSTQLHQHDVGFDVWTSRVAVEDWEGRTPGMATDWQASYDAEHAPIHGASLGMNAKTYLRAGGFSALAHSEDRALYEAAVSLGGLVFHDPSVRVVTSARRVARAPLGFSSALSSIERTGAVRAPLTAEIA